MLELEHISVRFAAGHGVQAVEDVSFTLEDGGRLAIVGETGSGKSVLLLSVLRLLPKSALVSGSARLDGEDLFAAGQKRLREIRGGVISYVPHGDLCRSPDHLCRRAHQGAGSEAGDAGGGHAEPAGD